MKEEITVMGVPGAKCGLAGEARLPLLAPTAGRHGQAVEER